MSPEEWIRHIRREHAEISHPVACCRKDHQNWPCDTIRALDAGVRVERQRITELAKSVRAGYQHYETEEIDGATLTTGSYEQFADLLREEP